MAQSEAQRQVPEEQDLAKRQIRRAYSWVCALGSLLASLGDHIVQTECKGWNLNWLQARQAHYLLITISLVHEHRKKFTFVVTKGNEKKLEIEESILESRTRQTKQWELEEKDKESKGAVVREAQQVGAHACMLGAHIQSIALRTAQYHQEWPLNTKSGVNPEYCWVWLQTNKHNKPETERKKQKVIQTNQETFYFRPRIFRLREPARGDWAIVQSVGSVCLAYDLHEFYPQHIPYGLASHMVPKPARNDYWAQSHK